MFYLCGGLGVIWFVLWICLVHSDQSTHPRMSTVELLYIQRSLRDEKSSKDGTKTPLLDQEGPVSTAIPSHLSIPFPCA